MIGMQKVERQSSLQYITFVEEQRFYIRDHFYEVRFILQLFVVLQLLQALYLFIDRGLVLNLVDVVDDLCLDLVQVIAVTHQRIAKVEYDGTQLGIDNRIEK